MRKSHTIKNVKCQLSNILCENTACRCVVVNTIKEICRDISQMAVKASQLCWLMMEMLLEADWQQSTAYGIVTLNDNTCLEWPDFRKLKVFKDLLIVGSVNEENNITPAVKYAWNRYSSNLLPDGYTIKRRFKDQTLIKHCAMTYQSTVLSFLKKWFIRRQRLAIEIFLKEYHGYDASKHLVYALQCLINRWQYRGKSVYTSVELEKIYRVILIEKHQQHLPFQIINAHKLQPFEILRYYYFLKKEYGHASTEIRDFILIPQNHVKIHHITFDTVGVQCLRNEIDKKIFSQLKMFISVKEKEENAWQSIFNMERIMKMGKKSIFNKCIVTNGLDCTIKYLSVDFW